MRFYQLPLLISGLFLVGSAARARSSASIAAISSRAFCETNQSVIVTEFTLRGDTKASYILRGLGPSLTGAPDPLGDPRLRLLSDTGRRLDLNDNWMDNPDKRKIIATGIAPTNDLESAIIDRLPAGTYTSVVEGVGRTSGTAIADAYDLSFGALELAAAGVRGQTLGGDDMLMSEVIITGNNSISLLIRALGPSLTDAGLRGALADPFLELANSNGDLIATNDNWRDTQEQEIIATGLAPAHDSEAAIVVALAPGAYTAIGLGAFGETGLTFVQFYSLENLPVPELNPAPPIKR